MSIFRILPAWLHAIADYAVAALLIVVPLAVGGSREAVAAGVVIGGVVLVVSLLTRYPLGLIKVVPFRVHSGADYLAVALLGAAPAVLGFRTSDPGLAAVYYLSGLAVLAVSVITNYQYSPRRDRSASAPRDDVPSPRPSVATPATRLATAPPTRRPRPLHAPGR